MPNNLSVSIVDSAKEFFALKDEWNELVKSDELATIFQTWEFQYHTWCIFADRITPYLLLVRNKNNKLIACAPMGTRTWGVGPLSVRILEFASARYCDYSNFILHRDFVEDSLSILARWFHTNLCRWDAVWLRPIREDSMLIRENLFLSKIGYPFQIRQRSTAPYLRFQKGFLTYEDALSKKKARSIRYKVNKLFRRFDGTFEGVADGQLLDEAMNHLMDLHQKRMREKNEMGAFALPSAREEFRALIKKLGARGLAKVHAIRSNEKTIASLCTFEFRGTVSYYQGGFDTDYRQLSPGMVIHPLRINEAIKNGALEYDFLDGDEPYKFTWANGRRKLYSIKIMTGSWRASLYYWFIRLRLCLAQSDRLRAVNLWLRRSLK